MVADSARERITAAITPQNDLRLILDCTSQLCAPQQEEGRLGSGRETSLKMKPPGICQMMEWIGLLGALNREGEYDAAPPLFKDR